MSKTNNEENAIRSTRLHGVEGTCRELGWDGTDPATLHIFIRQLADDRAQARDALIPYTEAHRYVLDMFARLGINQANPFREMCKMVESGVESSLRLVDVVNGGDCHTTVRNLQYDAKRTADRVLQLREAGGTDLDKVKAERDKLQAERDAAVSAVAAALDEIHELKAKDPWAYFRKKMKARGWTYSEPEPEDHDSKPWYHRGRVRRVLEWLVER